MRINIFVSISALILAIGAPGASLFAQLTQVDPTFNAVPSRPLTSAMSHLVQPDGKVIVYGSKTVIDGVPTASIARLNTDGSRDPSFSYCDCALSSVTSARLLPDGKISVAGRDGTTAKIIRLNSDGSVDPTFLVSIPAGGFFHSTLYVEAVQPDGKILVMEWSSVNTNQTYSVSRYNTEGTRDSSFTGFTIVSGTNFGASVRILLLPDGRFYVAENVTNGSGWSGILRRRNANGSIDSTWETPTFTSDPGFPPNVFIYDFAVAADGSVLAVGRFNTVNGLAKPNFVKLLSAGNVDVGFPVPSTGANRVYILPDGKILFGTSSR